MKQGKEVYDSIVIPDELSKRVEEAIASVDKKKLKERRRQRQFFRITRTCGALAASFLVCLTVGVNSSQVLAYELGNIPVLGSLARVLTVRSYQESADNVMLTASVPEIRIEDQAEAGVAENEEEAMALSGNSADMEVENTQIHTWTEAEINAEISQIVDDFIANAKTDMEEYKEAFFATGGTEEEWANRTMEINVDYEVKYQQGDYLSLVLHAEEAWVAAYQENYYYNLDLVTNQRVTLQDLLGENYIEICNAAIMEQIEQRIIEGDDQIFFGYGPMSEEFEEHTFTTITPDTSFYINENGNPVICFAKYEIAPGYMGVCEFEIK